MNIILGVLLGISICINVILSIFLVSIYKRNKRNELELRCWSICHEND